MTRRVGASAASDVYKRQLLSDAYLYANNFLRFSGFRHEVGLAPIAGFYKLDYHLPQSYAVQHIVTASAIAGFGLADFDIGSNQSADVWFTTGYELGLYPTTRTNVNIGAQIGTTIFEQEFAGRIFGNGSFWFSPLFRLNFTASVIVGNGNIASDLNSFIQSNVLDVNSTRLNATVGLSYAIF